MATTRSTASSSKVKSAVFEGQIRIWDRFVYGKLGKDEVLLGTSIANAKELIGSTIEYRLKAGTKYFEIVGLQIQKD